MSDYNIVSTENAQTVKACITIDEKSYKLYEGHNTIGKHKESTVLINNTRISLYHAIITIFEDEHFLSDLQSSNGTTLNEIKLKALKLYKLSESCLIEFGNIQAKYTKIPDLQSIANEEYDEQFSQGLSSFSKTSTPPLNKVQAQEDKRTKRLEIFDDDYNFTDIIFPTDNSLDLTCQATPIKEKTDACVVPSDNIHDLPTQHSSHINSVVNKICDTNIKTNLDFKVKEKVSNNENSSHNTKIPTDETLHSTPNSEWYIDENNLLQCLNALKQCKEGDEHANSQNINDPIDVQTNHLQQTEVQPIVNENKDTDIKGEEINTIQSITNNSKGTVQVLKESTNSDSDSDTDVECDIHNIETLKIVRSPNHCSSFNAENNSNSPTHEQPLIQQDDKNLCNSDSDEDFQISMDNSDLEEKHNEVKNISELNESDVIPATPGYSKINDEDTTVSKIQKYDKYMQNESDNIVHGPTIADLKDEESGQSLELNITDTQACTELQNIRSSMIDSPNIHNMATQAIVVINPNIHEMETQEFVINQSTSKTNKKTCDSVGKNGIETTRNTDALFVGNEKENDIEEECDIFLQQTQRVDIIIHSYNNVDKSKESETSEFFSKCIITEDNEVIPDIFDQCTQKIECLQNKSYESDNVIEKPPDIVLHTVKQHDKYSELSYTDSPKELNKDGINPPDNSEMDKTLNEVHDTDGKNIILQNKFDILEINHNDTPTVTAQTKTDNDESKDNSKGIQNTNNDMNDKYKKVEADLEMLFFSEIQNEVNFDTQTVCYKSETNSRPSNPLVTVLDKNKHSAETSTDQISTSSSAKQDELDNPGYFKTMLNLTPIKKNDVLEPAENDNDHLNKTCTTPESIIESETNVKVGEKHKISNTEIDIQDTTKRKSYKTRQTLSNDSMESDVKPKSYLPSRNKRSYRKSKVQTNTITSLINNINKVSDEKVNLSIDNDKDESNEDKNKIQPILINLRNGYKISLPKDNSEIDVNPNLKRKLSLRNKQTGSNDKSKDDINMETIDTSDNNISVNNIKRKRKNKNSVQSRKRKILPKNEDTTCVESDSESSLNHSTINQTSLLETSNVKRNTKMRNVANRTYLLRDKGRSNDSNSGYDTSTSSTSEQKVKHSKLKIVFTFLDSPELENIIKALGGTIVDSVEASAVLVTTCIKRSQKFLTAVALGKPICSENWLKRCQTANAFLDPWDFLLVDPEAEQKWNFSLERSLKRSTETRMFQNYTFYITCTTINEVLKVSIESCGGKCVKKMLTKIPENFFIVGDPKDETTYRRFLNRTPPSKVITPEAIFDSVLRQEIHFENNLIE